MPRGTVAILTTHGFEDLELFYPKYRLEEAGYGTEVLTPDGRPVTGKHGYEAAPDGAIGDADPGDFAALHLPGGSANADKLRMADDAVAFARDFCALEPARPVLAICHAAWLLVEADVLDGVRMTAYPSLRTDLENAGAAVEDAEVVVDGRFVTSRWPDDLPAYMREALGLLEKAGS